MGLKKIIIEAVKQYVRNQLRPTMKEDEIMILMRQLSYGDRITVEYKKSSFGKMRKQDFTFLFDLQSRMLITSTDVLHEGQTFKNEKEIFYSNLYSISNIVKLHDQKKKYDRYRRNY